MQNPGIDPGTSPMLGGRSTIWANRSPRGTTIILNNQVTNKETVLEAWPDNELVCLTNVLEFYVRKKNVN